METWKEIEGYENLYEVSNLGRIRSLGRICNTKDGATQKKRARILTQEITIHGYCRVRLYDSNGKAKHCAVHRLVASAFIGSISEDMQINHINEIKTDNRVENLEICTPKQNCNHGTRNIRLSKANTGKKHTQETKAKLSLINSVPVIQETTSGVYVQWFRSKREASRKTGICESHIGACVNGKRKTAGGYVWRSVNG